MGPYIDRLPPKYRDMATRAGLRRGGSIQTRSSDVGTIIEGQYTIPPPNTNPPPTADAILPVHRARPEDPSLSRGLFLWARTPGGGIRAKTCLLGGTPAQATNGPPLSQSSLLRLGGEVATALNILHDAGALDTRPKPTQKILLGLTFAKRYLHALSSRAMARYFGMKFYFRRQECGCQVHLVRDKPF